MSGSVEIADIAIVGAGILGCSIAWHVKRRDPTARVVVVERQGSVATQATSQAAALLTRGRSNPALIPMIERTYAAIDELGDELPMPPPLHRVGVLHLASSEAGIRDLQRLAQTAVAAGLRVEQPHPAELGALVPWLDPARVRECRLMPDDGFIDPYLLAAAYAEAARHRGVQFQYATEVKAIRVAGGQVCGLATSAGPVDAPAVVLAAGAWANRLTAPLRCGLAMAPVRSQYWLTGEDALFPSGHPATVIPEARAYTRPELGGLLFGLREPQSVSLDANDLPDEMSGYAFADDPEGSASLEAGAPALSRFCPALERVGIRDYIAGLSTYTPDGLFLAGPVPGTAGLLVASGCCGAGIAASGGFGEVLAALALGERRKGADAFAPARFGPVAPSDPAFRARCAAARSRKTAG